MATFTLDAIHAEIHAGNIKVTRSNGELTGIYATQEVAKNLDPMQIQSALIQPSTRENAPFELGHTIYHLSISDFVRTYGDTALANAQTLPARTTQRGNTNFIG